MVSSAASPRETEGKQQAESPEWIPSRFDVFHQTTDNHGSGVIAEGVHVHFHGIFEVLVNQHRMVGLHLNGLTHVAVEFFFVEHHLHGPPAQDVGRRTTTG